MLSILDSGSRPGGLGRRELLRVGGLGALGLSLPGLLAARAESAVAGPLAATFGRARSCIFLWLQGGPPQHETFDPKPGAPAEVRGPFRPTSTSVPGITVCEHLPKLAARMHRVLQVRSVRHTDAIHDHECTSWSR